MSLLNQVGLFPKLFSKTFVFFSGFHIFKATGCCRKRCRLVHFPADWEASDRRWCGLGQTSFSLFIIVTIVNRAANLGVEKPKSVTESFDILIGSRTSQLRTNRGRCVEPWCLSIFPSHCLLLVWFYWFWRWNPQTWTLATSCHHCIFRPSWPKKALKRPRWGQRVIWGWLSWHGWNFCGMQRWLLFRQKIGDFVPLESVEREVIRWCDNH